jgi:putative ABC transport system permease protein
MAVNDILSNPKRFLAIMISFGLCTLFVLMLVNTTATIESPNLLQTFCTKSDLYVTNINDVMKYMHTDKEEVQKRLSEMSYQINFTDNSTKEEIEHRKERIKKLYHNDKVMNATEYCIDCTSVSGTLERVQYLLLGITLVVVILVTILMERSFIADEKSQIAILKAIGFQNNVYHLAYI